MTRPHAPRSLTVIEFTIPPEVVPDLRLNRGPIGEIEGLRPLDIARGTGFEQWTRHVAEFNAALASGKIKYRRLRF